MKNIRKSTQYYIYLKGGIKGGNGTILERIETDPSGKFLPPIGAYSELQAIAFYVKKVLKFVGSEEETRKKLGEYRAVQVCSGVDKYIPPTSIAQPSTADRQMELTSEGRNAQLL